MTTRSLLNAANTECLWLLNLVSGTDLLNERLEWGVQSFAKLWMGLFVVKHDRHYGLGRMLEQVLIPGVHQHCFCGD